MKKTTRKPIRKTAKKPTKKVAKKPIKKVIKKPTTKKTTRKPQQSTLQKLKAKENASFKAMDNCVKEWETKLSKARNAEQRRKIDSRYNEKFKKLDRENTIRSIDVEICKKKKERQRLVQLKK